MLRASVNGMGRTATVPLIVPVVREGYSAAMGLCCDWGSGGKRLPLLLLLLQSVERRRGRRELSVSSLCKGLDRSKVTQ